MTDPNFSAIRARLRYETIEDFIKGYSRFISGGGMFIPMRPTNLKPIGTTIRFQFLLGDGATALLGEGVVLQVRQPDDANPRSPVGMLVKFTKLSQESKILVDRILAEKNASLRGESDSAIHVPKSPTKPFLDDAPDAPEIVERDDSTKESHRDIVAAAQAAASQKGITENDATPFPDQPSPSLDSQFEDAPEAPVPFREPIETPVHPHVEPAAEQREDDTGVTANDVLDALLAEESEAEVTEAAAKDEPPTADVSHLLLDPEPEPELELEEEPDEEPEFVLDLGLDFDSEPEPENDPSESELSPDIDASPEPEPEEAQPESEEEPELELDLGLDFDSEPEVEPQAEEEVELQAEDEDLDPLTAEAPELIPEPPTAEAPEPATAEVDPDQVLSETDESEEVVEEIEHHQKLGQTEGGLQILAFDNLTDDALKELEDFSFVAEEEDIDDMFDGLFGSSEAEDDFFGAFGGGDSSAEPVETTGDSMSSVEFELPSEEELEEEPGFTAEASEPSLDLELEADSESAEDVFAIPVPENEFSLEDAFSSPVLAESDEPEAPAEPQGDVFESEPILDMEDASFVTDAEPSEFEDEPVQELGGGSSPVLDLQDEADEDDIMLDSVLSFHGVQEEPAHSNELDSLLDHLDDEKDENQELTLHIGADAEPDEPEEEEFEDNEYADEESLESLLASARKTIEEAHPEEAAPDGDIIDQMFGGDDEMPAPPQDVPAFDLPQPTSKRKKGFMSKLFGKD